ncbi:MAG: biopolymer transporter ExbD, partial [Aquaticitalea sp.]
GLNRKLPPIDDEQVEPPVIKQKNIFTVLINKHNQLLVEDELMELGKLRQAALEFLDNGGGTGDEACSYCHGKKNPASSDNPDKAIVSLKNERETTYATYISVQNELVAAYNFLRDRRAKELYGMTLAEMEKDYDDVNYSGNKSKLKEKIEKIKIEFPQKLSEVQ